MNLLLISKGLGAINTFLRQVSTIGFIPTAGEPYEDPSFVEEDRTRLIELGFDVRNLDITNSDRADILARIAKVDALFIAGGNTFYLMQQIRAKGLVEDLKSYILDGHRFIGASAGAVICGPTVEPIRTLDDPQAAPLLQDLAGLGIVDFVVLPHYGKPKYLDRYHDIVREYSDRLTLIPLRDDQAILVTSKSQYEIVPS
jgi:dipeptidase E